MTKMKVAIMSHELDVRPERTLFFRRLVEGLLERPEVELTLIHFESMPDEPLYKRTREILIPKVSLPVGSRFISFIRFCLTTKERFDIVHWLKPRIFPFFWLFPARKTIVMAHGGGERLAPGFWTAPRFIFLWTIILFQKSVDALIAVSDYANREVIYAYRVPPEKVRTIYPLLDTIYAALPNGEKVRTTLESYQLKPETYFLYIGRFHIHKNVGNLVEAYLRYREHNPQSSELLAVFGGGSRERYEQTFGPIRNSAFVKDIRFFDYIPAEHLPILYSGARALAFVTLNEGFGLPIIEAMACGTPVITSSVTSMPEVAGNAALIVSPTNPQALAEAFKMISGNPSLREELIQRGLARSAFFSFERVITDTVALYHDVLDTQPLVYNPASVTLSS